MSASQRSQDRNSPSSTNSEITENKPSDHRQDLLHQLKDITDQYTALRNNIDQLRANEASLKRIDEWEKDSIRTIRSTAEKVRADLRQITEASKTRLNILMNTLDTSLMKSRKENSLTENNIEQWKIQLEHLRKDLHSSSGLQVTENDTPLIRLITVPSHENKRDEASDAASSTKPLTPPTTERTDRFNKSPRDNRDTVRQAKPTGEVHASLSKAPDCCLEFGLTHSNNTKLKTLFQHLMKLDPMNKNGSMSGKCEAETSQMERFLSDTFGFQNIPHQCIVQGVKSFRLQNYPDALDPNTIVHFPDASSNAFTMNIEEIIKWQQSYKVYAYKISKYVTKDLLVRALQGLSTDGYEAFLMKYVVRISTCPILMEFDAKIIARELDQEWPNCIKLVSVTGIDFAGRKHDVDDILFYVSNWREVYEIDHTADRPALANERDFRRKRRGESGILYEERVLRSLKDMARLRLRACDEEGVQIVVETGIGLGVFAGEHIGIAEQVQITSAMAIRTVLEEDGSKYKNIQAIVFALPVFDQDHSRRANSPLDVFTEQFHTPEYKGPIPVLIADQDMHRLTVAIARLGYTVSQLNPADSHGVFGEYWQNRGPAVEEKLALTTLGLLVQHHLINQHVLDPKNYKILPYPEDS